MCKTVIFFEHGVETLTYFSRQLAEAFDRWLMKCSGWIWKWRGLMPGSCGRAFPYMEMQGCDIKAFYRNKIKIGGIHNGNEFT